MARNARFNRRLRIENLERRELLCSSAAGASGLQLAAQSALFARSHTAPSLTLGSPTTSSSASDEASETHLFTTLTNSSGVVVGTAFYETEVHGTTTTQELVISVVGAAANASYAVTVGTTNLGTLMTDANGNGQLCLTSSSTSTTTPPSSPTAAGTLPAGFTVAAGATIGLASTDPTVAALNGTFATASGDIGIGNGRRHGCHGDNGNVTRLVAPLTNAGVSAGRAVLKTFTNSDGTTTQILRVHVTGADPNATLPVSIDGTSVGTINTDSNGNGSLILSSNPQNSNVGQLPAGLTITSSSTITVGTSITGTFASPSTTGTPPTSSVATTRSFVFRRR